MEKQLSKLDNFQNVEDMLGMCTTLIESGLIPKQLNRPEKVAAIIMQGRELGFGAVTSLNNLHNIRGKVTLSVHAIAALVKRAGIKYKILEDAVYVNKDGSTSLNKTDESIDQRTTIKFYEKLGDTIIENDFSFYYSEAVAMDLSSKDNWQKMRKVT